MARSCLSVRSFNWLTLMVFLFDIRALVVLHRFKLLACDLSFGCGFMCVFALLMYLVCKSYIVCIIC